MAAYFADQCAARESGQCREYATVDVDDGGHAGVGRAQHHAAGFEGAHLGDLQVLRRRQRVAEPGDVGDVHQQRRGRQRADDFLAEGVLVADVHRDLLAGDAQRRLWFAPA